MAPIPFIKICSSLENSCLALLCSDCLLIEDLGGSSLQFSDYARPFFAVRY